MMVEDDHERTTASLPAPTADERSIAITGTDGRLHQVSVVAASGSAERTARVSLHVPLARPLLLGDRTTMLNVVYHADIVSTGWVQSGLAVSANKGHRFFDWLGGRPGPGLVRVPVEPGSVLAAGGIDVVVDMRIRARHGGKASLALDVISVTDP